MNTLYYKLLRTAINIQKGRVMKKLRRENIRSDTTQYIYRTQWKKRKRGGDRPNETIIS